MRFPDGSTPRSSGAHWDRAYWPGRLIARAVVFRLCSLAGGPFYEDDLFRYRRDAYRFAQDGRPYRVATEAFFSDPSVPAAFQRTLT